MDNKQCSNCLYENISIDSKPCLFCINNGEWKKKNYISNEARKNCTCIKIPNINKCMKCDKYFGPVLNKRKYYKKQKNKYIEV